MTTFNLLIIFTDETRKTVKNVETYKYHEDFGAFSFEKNGYRSFIPKDNVKYFGREFDWLDEQ